MRTFSPHLAILPAAQRRLWPALRPLSDLGFVLYGGTAIALRLGHRPSLDFDFFSDQPLEKQALYARLPFLQHATVLQETPDTLTFLTAAPAAPIAAGATGMTQREPAAAPVGDAEFAAENSERVKLSLFGSLSFGRVGEPERTDDGVAQVAALDDLLATKLKVLLQRVEAKDYSDIDALLTAGVRLDIGLAGARTLFGPTFQPSECLKALVYFEGGDLASLPTTVRTTLIEATRAVGALSEVPLRSRSLAAPTASN